VHQATRLLTLPTKRRRSPPGSTGRRPLPARMWQPPRMPAKSLRSRRNRSSTANMPPPTSRLGTPRANPGGMAAQHITPRRARQSRQEPQRCTARQPTPIAEAGQGAWRKAPAGVGRRRAQASLAPPNTPGPARGSMLRRCLPEYRPRCRRPDPGRRSAIPLPAPGARPSCSRRFRYSGHLRPTTCRPTGAAFASPAACRQTLRGSGR